jgi:hypothetical protein
MNLRFSQTLFTARLQMAFAPFDSEQSYVAVYF